MKSAVGKNAYTGTIVSGMEARVPDAALTRAAVDVVSDEPAPVRQEVRSMRGLGALDAALLLKVNRLPHTTTSDKYFSLVSDLGRGLAGPHSAAGWHGVAAATGAAQGCAVLLRCWSPTQSPRDR
jgi:hypothetical protein